jgi:hypothetical protein
MALRRKVAAACTMMLGLAGQAQPAGRPSVAVVAYNQAGVAADILTRAKIEIARIYGEAGVEVIWMDPAAVEPAGRFAMRLLLRPHAVNASGLVMGTAIGDVHNTGGSAFVFYDRVLQSAHERRQDVAGVLAYAVAHEMGHLLLPSPAHSELGIMRADWDGDDLRRISTGVLQFTAVQMSAIRVKASTCCGALAAGATSPR